MEAETIGSFEAKTHFSQILKEVQAGKEFHVTLRGKRVAVIKKEGDVSGADALKALRHLARFRDSLSTEEIVSLRDEGRER